MKDVDYDPGVIQPDAPRIRQRFASNSLYARRAPPLDNRSSVLYKLGDGACCGNAIFGASGQERLGRSDGRDATAGGSGYDPSRAPLRIRECP
jgi:hypothetical protein